MDNAQVAEENLIAERDELDYIADIARRGQTILDRMGIAQDHIDLLMDIEWCHVWCPLDLAQFRDLDDENFAHDFLGIYRHFNRETKELEDCFLPRCAQ